MADALEIVAKFVADTGDLEAGAEKAKGAIGGIGPGALIAGAGVVAGIGIAVTAIAEMTLAADEDRAAQEKLELAYKASGAATGDYKAKIDEAIDAGKAKAFSDDEVRAGLDSLVTSTGDAQKANDLLAIAMDVARKAGVPLADASDAVAKANEGQDGSLRKLLPGLAKGKDATDTLALAQKAAEGQSDAFAASTEGQMKKAGDAFGELKETIGQAFLPILDELVPAITPFIELLGELLKVVLPVLSALIKNVVVPAFKLIVDIVKLLFDWLGKIVTAISTNLKPIFDGLIPVLKAVADAFGNVVNFVKSLLDWLGKAADAVGHLLDSLNPLKNFQLPSISLPFSLAAPAPAGVAATRGARSMRQAGVTNVTINTSADPEAVVRALQRWAGNNGGRGTFLRALDRAAG